MKRTLSAFVAAAVAVTSAPGASWAGDALEFHASHELQAVHNDIRGPGRASSSLSDKWRYLEVLNLDVSGKKSGWDYGLNTGIKGTDDLRNDPKAWSLTNAQGRLSKGSHAAQLGDTFASFSQYALATPIKGGSYRFLSENSHLPEVTGVYGWAVPRWDAWWRDDQTRTVRRLGGGGRLRQTLLPDLWVAASALTAKDTERRNTTDALYNARNYTGDFSYSPIPGLTATGELSASESELSPDTASAYRKSKGTAARFELVGDGGPSRVALTYENVRPSFYSAFGSATPDRRKGKAAWRYKPAKNVTYNLGFLWFRNNLGGNSAFTTSNFKPEAAVTRTRLLPRRPFSVGDFSYRFDRKYGGTTSGADHYFNAGFRDRFKGIDSSTVLGYTRYRTKASVRNSDEIIANTSLNSRIELDDKAIRPSIAAGLWYSRDELAFTTDKVYDYSAGLGIDAPRSKVTTDFRVGQNRVIKESGESSTKVFGSLAAYWTPPLPAVWGRHTLFARGNHNGYFFSTNTRNFRETSMTFGVNTEF